MICKSFSLLVILGLLVGYSAESSDVVDGYEVVAEKFFRGVYGGDQSVVGECAADDIVISYPIFQTLFNSPIIKGRNAVVNFINRFSTKWKEPKITVHETITEGKSVVLVWSFQARDAFYDSSSQSDAGPHKSWGGITVYHFNEAGEIETEVGEESEPGPIGRLSSGTSNI